MNVEAEVFSQILYLCAVWWILEYILFAFVYARVMLWRELHAKNSHMKHRNRKLPLLHTHEEPEAKIQILAT